MYEFTDEATVKNMRAHSEYVEVLEEAPTAPVVKPAKKEKV